MQLYKEFRCRCSLLKCLVIDCVGVEILMSETFLVCPDFSEIIGLCCQIAKAFKADLLYVRILYGHQCVLFYFKINGLIFNIVYAHTQEITLRVNRDERGRNIMLFG